MQIYQNPNLPQTTVRTGQSCLRLLFLDEAIKSRLLPLVPDLEVESEGHATWNIEDYRRLPKRVHGPSFEVGGHPW